MQNGKTFFYHNGRWIPAFYDLYGVLDYPLTYLGVTGTSSIFTGLLTKAWNVSGVGFAVSFVVGGVVDFHQNYNDYENRYYTKEEQKERSKIYEKVKEMRLKAGGIDE